MSRRAARKAGFAAGGLVVCMASASCYPVTVSAACRQQMDRCLARCEPVEGRTAPDPHHREWGANDYRTQCVQQCHDICT